MPLPDHIGYADLYEVAPTSAIDRSGVRPLNEWMEILNGVHAGYLSVQISDTPPASPFDGSFWWQSSSGRLFIRYNDGNSSQWCETVGRIAGDISAGLVTATDGDTKTLGDWMAYLDGSTPLDLPGNNAPWTNVPVNGETASIHRMADRVMVADAVAYPGANTGGATGTWLSTDGSTSFMDYLLINAGFASVVSAYKDATTPSNASYAIVGAARAQGKTQGGGIIGVAGYARNDAGAVPFTGWGGYFEAKRTAVGCGAAIGIEIDASSTVPVIGSIHPYQQFGGNQSIALWLAAGGGSGVNPVSYDAVAAIGISRNSAGFQKGIVFMNDAVTFSGAYAPAIVMGPGQTVEWYQSATNTVGASITSSISDAAHRTHLTFQDAGLTLKDTGENVIFRASWLANPVNYPVTAAGIATGDAVYGVSGTDTNANVSIIGKGTGGVRLRDGAGANKVQVNTTGIGFFAATPVAKPTVGAALSTGGAETNTNLATRINDLRTALVNLGLAA